MLITLPRLGLTIYVSILCFSWVWAFVTENFRLLKGSFVNLFKQKGISSSCLSFLPLACELILCGCHCSDTFQCLVLHVFVHL